MCSGSRIMTDKEINIPYKRKNIKIKELLHEIDSTFFDFVRAAVIKLYF